MNLSYSKISESSKLHAWIRLICALIFLLAGFAKFFSFSSFAGYLSQFVIIPHPYFVAKFIIVCEIIVGFLLLNKMYERVAVSLALLLLLTFLSFSAINIVNGNFESCHCFGFVSILNLPFQYHLPLLVILLVCLSVLLFKNRSGAIFSPMVRKAINILLVGLVLVGFFYSRDEAKKNTEIPSLADFKVNNSSIFKKIMENDGVKTRKLETIPLKKLINTRGKTIVTFFAPTQCYMCLGYLRDIPGLASHYDFPIIVVAYNTSWGEARSFLKSYGLA